MSETYKDQPYPVLRTELGNLAEFYGDKYINDVATRSRAALERQYQEISALLEALKDAQSWLDYKAPGVIANKIANAIALASPSVGESK